MNRPSEPVELADLRQYIRLKSVFPVAFSIVRLQGDLPGINWQQGYTCNVSRGGLCLETVELNESIIEFIQRQHIFLDLKISIPLARPPIKAVAEIAWFKKITEGNHSRYMIGLHFRSIIEKDLNRIMGQAKWLRFSGRTAIFVSFLLLTAVIIGGVYTYKLRQANELIIGNFIQAQQEEALISESLEKLNRQKVLIFQQLQKFTQDIEGDRNRLAEMAGEQPGQTISQQLAERQREVERLKARMREAMNEMASLENRYTDLMRRQTKTADLLTVLTRRKTDMQKVVLEKMVLWLKNHRNSSTGLVLSFEGDVGIIQDWAFIYDQALAVQVFLLFNDRPAAQSILNFFNLNLTADFKGFPNAYYFDSGKVAEAAVHAGPNTWLGIAALHYIQQTGDRDYLPLATTIADWLIALQDRDTDGGIKGGPGVFWFSTEHNLDAYAFFNMLAAVTGEEKYRTARDKTLLWLKEHALVPHSADYKSPPVNRGKGDATIATDTFAWALAAIGPDKLEALGMEPEKIMNFAEENCGVTVAYHRPSGIKVIVRGFDFARKAHLPRGGLISPEWTSQMIVSYQILSAYFKRKNDSIKAQYYSEKAKMYLRELNKLIITSPSAKGQGRGCLPYATLDQADTGHGWNTPPGLDTCSIAGTAYTIMAIKEFNPLMLKANGEIVNP